jgi:hypothetical protein
MKKQIFLFTLALALTFLFLRFTGPKSEKVKELNKIAGFAIPDSIKPILDKSCFGCHSKDSKNDKAKAKLSFDVMDTLSQSKLVGKLSKITEELKKGAMPPPKFLERFPDAKLTDEGKQKLIAWSEEESNKLMKK